MLDVVAAINIFLIAVAFGFLCLVSQEEARAEERAKREYRVKRTEKKAA